jgi:hypothetical protein
LPAVFVYDTPKTQLQDKTMTTNTSKRDYVIIVSGLPRSGTSMMMKALDAGGIDTIVDNIRKADEDNPKGYYEFEPVKKTKDDASWLKDASGKVVKMVYRLLYDLPAEYQYRVVFTLRDLKEVLASQTKMLQRSGKSGGGISDDQMEALFKAELAKCEKWLAEQPNFKVLYINHRDMINDGLVQAQKINDFLDSGLDINAMASVVDPALYRNRNQ